jgi:hypothetical protein
MSAGCLLLVSGSLRMMAVIPVSLIGSMFNLIEDRGFFLDEYLCW